MSVSGSQDVPASQQEQQAEEAARKRKLKFSEPELETLITEMVQHHDSLFGATSHKVPEASKRRIWEGIQAKVNALGVTHRTVDVLRKRWYDLRQRSKERLAARLEQSQLTGGGTSNVQDSTPLEELVEGTLPHQSVAGVSVLDSSAQPSARPAPASGKATASATETGARGSGEGRHGHDPDGEDSPIIQTQGHSRRNVRPFRIMDDEEEENDNVQRFRAEEIIVEMLYTHFEKA
ncbi:uncharacterized protein LOC144783942 [Lissotriton helveticus]